MVAIIGYVIGVIGFLFAARFYLELRRWARECKGVQVAVSYKGKVKMSPSLEEIILWARRVPEKGGTVFFGMGGTRIAVINRVKAQDSQSHLSHVTTNGRNAA